MEIETPECQKMIAVAPESQKIGAFIDWLQESYTICERVEAGGWGAGAYTPTRKSIEKLLAEYFEIDLDKVEEERRAILSLLSD